MIKRGPFLVPFGIHLGVILGSIWGPFGDHFGVRLGSLGIRGSAPGLTKQSLFSKAQGDHGVVYD